MDKIVEFDHKTIFKALRSLYVKEHGEQSINYMQTFGGLISRYSVAEIVQELADMKDKHTKDKQAQEILRKKEEEQLIIGSEKCKGLKIRVYTLVVTTITFGSRCENFDVKTFTFRDREKAVEKAYDMLYEWLEHNRPKELDNIDLDEDGEYCLEYGPYQPEFETSIKEQIMNFDEDVLCSSEAAY